ncbi:hypothetical protein GUJ93_ZPchr0006g43749 [Zizania palustris]|uniref:Uncharacterized protein n=1 Tax=Zizania palustris TaxID=103762 RepID=A0A8J5SIP4_ZIZPA|nr:hypothetical protein GUJ93_ZPchr0006g43749 [Zizania palustris]
MASAVASSLPAPPPAVGFAWLGPRVSFGRDVVAGQETASSSSAAESAISKEFIDFEFSLGGAATMLPADELFSDGKLLPLRPHPVVQPETGREQERERDNMSAEIPLTPELVNTVRPLVSECFDPYVFSPKAPTCSSRWRELLRLKKVQSPQKPSPSASPSPSPAITASTPSRASNSSASRSLKLLLLQRNGGRASAAAVSDLSVAPLLRDSSDSEASLSLASSRFSLSSSSSSSHEHDDFSRHSVDSVDPTPRPRIRIVRSQPHTQPPAAAKPRAGQSPARRRPSTPSPPPPQVASVDSPRMNASGKVVFQGLERSCSSPAGSVHSSVRSRSRVMDRSYSAGVRATPVVLNVPVCTRPVFGFFKDKKDSPAKESASRPRSALGRKTMTAPYAVAGASSFSCRYLGTSN